MISQSDEDLSFIVSVFKLKLMCLLGFMPVIDECKSCGTSENLCYFSLKDSGIKCLQCGKQDKGAIKISDATAIAIKYIVMSPPKKLFSFHLSETAKNELELVSNLYLNDKLDKEYKNIKM